MNQSSAWLPQTAKLDGNSLPLLCFPHAGGGTSQYHQWRSLVADQVDVVPMRLPGREARIDDQPYTDLSRLADTMFADLSEIWSNPYALFGHSMGAAIAYEIARRAQLRAQPPVCLIVSACPPPDELDTQEPLHGLESQSMVDALIARYGMANEMGADERSLMLLLANTLRADLTMLETHKASIEPLDCPLVVCGGAEDPQVSRAALNRWQKFSKGEFTVRVFPGHHFYFKSQPTGLIDFIQKQLARLDRR